MSATACTVAANVHTECFDTYHAPINCDCVIALHPRAIVLACYELDEASGTKRGSLSTFRVTDDTKLAIANIFDTGALLDLALIDANIVAAVDSDGALSLFAIHADTLGLSLVSSTPITDSCLTYIASHGATIAVTDTGGSLSLLSLTDAAPVINHRYANIHSDSIWCAEFSGDANIVYTGSDDCQLLRIDTRTNSVSKSLTASHSAGVTAILSHSTDTNILYTGCYDERLRVFDIRHTRSPVREISLGGGVWRIIPNTDMTVLLIAAMHNGFHTLTVSDTDSASASGSVGWKADASYYGHQSLAYGCDWLNDSEGLVASCSFYDRSLHLWKRQPQSTSLS